jgi:hypothetical protein
MVSSFNLQHNKANSSQPKPLKQFKFFPKKLNVFLLILLLQKSLIKPCFSMLNALFE